MAGRHQGNTKEFRELSFAEQANSITATINNLQAAIEHHVGHSPRRRETIETCSAQVDRLRLQLESRYDLRLVPPGGGKRSRAWGRCPESASAVRVSRSRGVRRTSRWTSPRKRKMPVYDDERFAPAAAVAWVVLRILVGSAIRYTHWREAP